jgi:hypothetical protein
MFTGDITGHHGVLFPANFPKEKEEMKLKYIINLDFFILTKLSCMPIPWYVFPIGLMRLITVHYFCPFIDSNVELITTLYDKRYEFINFAIVIFPFLCSNIPLQQVYGENISQWIWYVKAYIVRIRTIQTETNYWKNSWCCRVITNLVKRPIKSNNLANSTVTILTSFAITNYYWSL